MEPRFPASNTPQTLFDGTKKGNSINVIHFLDVSQLSSPRPRVVITKLCWESICRDNCPSCTGIHLCCKTPLGTSQSMAWTLVYCVGVTPSYIQHRTVRPMQDRNYHSLRR
jgi:hypothetical protein